MKLFPRIASAGIILLLGACLMLPTGCGKKADKDGKATTTGGGDGGGEKTPKDYELFASKGGHEYHLRLKIDKKSKEAHAMVYDGENAEIKPIDAPALFMNVGDKEDIELKAVATPKGGAAAFMAMNERLASPVNLEKTEIKATIAKKQYIFVLDKDHD